MTGAEVFNAVLWCAAIFGVFAFVLDWATRPDGE